MKLQYLISAGLMAFCVNATAGIFDEDARREVKELRAELEKRDRDVDGRIQKLDESLKNLGIIQLLNQIEQLNAEISKLRGQIEVLGNQNDQLTKRQKDSISISIRGCASLKACRPMPPLRTPQFPLR